MKNLKFIFLLGVIAFLLGVLVGCEEKAVDKGQTVNPTGSLVGYTGCKTFKTGTTTDSISPNQSCIEYSYDGQGTLLLKHINAGFNCCPDSIMADIEIQDNIIVVEESESLESGGCYCLCLFDLDLEISNLMPGEYIIKVIEPYLCGSDEPLEFTINLSPRPSSGRYCVERGCYPWGIY